MISYLGSANFFRSVPGVVRSVRRVPQRQEGLETEQLLQGDLAVAVCREGSWSTCTLLHW